MFATFGRNTLPYDTSIRFRPDVILRLLPASRIHDIRRTDLANNPEHCSTHKQPNQIGKLGEARDANWSADTHIVQEAVKIRNDADNVSDICSQIPTSNVMIHPLFETMRQSRMFRNHVQSDNNCKGGRR
jgi:hypothetical protein